MSDKYNFDLNLGESFVVAIQWLDDAEAPIDLTGWTGTLSCAALSLALSLALDASGNITGQVLDTTGWTTGSHDYSLKVTDGDGNVSTILQGKICLHNIPLW